MLGPALSFDALVGWAEDDHAAAFRAFEKTAKLALERPPKTRTLGPSGNSLKTIADWLYHLDEGVLGGETKQFFEDHFLPRKVIANPDDRTKRGFVTGYYEPEVLGSRTRTGDFQTPVLKRPPDLVELADLDENVEIPENWDTSLRFARVINGVLEPYLDRQAIEEGGLPDDLSLVYLKDPIDAFFIHIQGSARIRLTDGSILRVSYDGKSGHPYTAIGRVLIEEGAIPREEMSMQAIREWLSTHRHRQFEVMWHNKSFIFFQEQTVLAPTDGPIGAAGVPLTQDRSLAVDRTLHTFGVPIFINVDHDTPINRLMIAQDTGSAIVGPARGDLFFGSGDDAEKQAGVMQNAADFFILWPKHEPF